METNNPVEEVIDDGHRPGKTDTPTRLLFQTKTFANFVIIKDNLLNDEWVSRAYQYSKTMSSNAWGEFVTTSELLHYENMSAEDIESLYKSNPQKAIAIVATKNLLFDRTRLPVDDIISQVDGRWNIVNSY